MSSVAELILESGAPEERDALEAFARHIRAARVAASAPAHDLPGLGRRATSAAVAEAAARNEARLWDARQAAYDNALSYTAAAERLGVSANQVSNLVSSGDLLALDGEAGRRLPAWQFHPETPRGRLDGIARVANAFPGRILGLTAWMTAENLTLDGRTPADALADGDVDLVVAAAEHAV